LVFITQMKSVYCAVRTGSLNKADCASYIKCLCNHNNNTWRAVQFTNHFVKQFFSAHSYFISCSDVFLSSVLSNSISLCYYLNMRDQVLHPYQEQTTLQFSNLILTSHSRKHYERTFRTEW
jgi:hypothetical protein